MSMDQFSQQIFAIIHQIPFGQVATYGQIAKMAGYPGYARHVGKVLGKLPEATRLPWFRVINSRGEISLSGQDKERQRTQLMAENIAVSEKGKVRLKQYQWQP
ncbi:O6-methylguanine-DNA methyltransferase [Vibrio cincinnatiensis]|uniref:Methylated-DNA-protein-cysteine methyltransferase related protein n=2 Tax=Vibrio cincinnatiensis TaxID=675 RepID=A0A1T4L570_VIBCI|nr:methylated-DNA-protein-cysteine methyltransferase related protein [Vibrio cincinnatiensis DSM 19608]SUP48209.1 O6-methylguanine-DNA methyltransferase [Vibrio cincinnatiensis]